MVRSSLAGLIPSVALLSVGQVASAAPAWQPSAKSVRWANQTVAISDFDCDAKGNDGIVISGQVSIVHPSPSKDAPQIIHITCRNILFENSSALTTAEQLHVRISGLVSGAANIINTRGTKGLPAKPTPGIWIASAARDGANGNDGHNGDDATDLTHGNHGSDRGSDGGRGQDGEHGAEGVLGAPGFTGTTAAKLQLRAGAFSDGATLTMTAIGGEGGTGGKGGRGQDGGVGGKGGRGGKGGDGNLLHPGSSGGNGGGGGDGGDGGNGGQGGDGGAGGNGGDVNFYMLAGGQPPSDINLVADGGKGGEGGEGGDFGLGGLHGTGGSFGCGGKGGEFIIKTNADGSCGTEGVNGQDGRDGRKGPRGVYGPDGLPGHIGRIDAGFIRPEDF